MGIPIIINLLVYKNVSEYMVLHYYFTISYEKIIAVIPFIAIAYLATDVL